METVRQSSATPVLVADQQRIQESRSRRSAKGITDMSTLGNAKSFTGLRNEIDNMALSDEGSTMLRKSTPLRKSPNSVRDNGRVRGEKH